MLDKDDDPTVELEPLSEAACAEFQRANDSITHAESRFRPDGPTLTTTEPDVADVEAPASLIQELREALKFREEMNSILQLGIDQQHAKCDTFAVQLANLQDENAGLRVELEQIREQATKTRKKLAEARQIEKALLEQLKELGDAKAGRAELSVELERSNAQVERYRTELEELRRELSITGRQSLPRGSDSPREQSNGIENCWVLTGLDDDVAGTYAVGEGVVTIGSSADNDIRISSKFVSQHHAQMINTPKGCVLGDLNSTNGTFINSRRISKRVLRQGDVVTVGKHRFRFEKQLAAAPAADISQYARRMS